MRHISLAIVAAAALAGCAAMPIDGKAPVTVEPFTAQDLYTAMLIAGIDPADGPIGLMPLKAKRVVAGICLASAKVHTDFDAQADAICTPLMAQFAPVAPAVAPIPEPKPE